MTKDFYKRLTLTDDRKQRIELLEHHARQFSRSDIRYSLLERVADRLRVLSLREEGFPQLTERRSSTFSAA